jgi:hypothetical protein
MNSISVKRAVHLKASPGDSLYALPQYVSRVGLTLIDNVRAEALHFDEQGRKHYYSRQLIQRQAEDNGRSWRVVKEWTSAPGGMRQAGEHQFPLGLFLLPGPDVLVELNSIYTYRPDEPMFGLGNSISRTYRTLCRHSRDSGRTWSEWRQIIDHRPGYDARRWAPGVEVGVQGGVGDGQAVLMDDATILMSFMIQHPQAPSEDVSARAKELYSTELCAQAHWDAERSELIWTFGEKIEVSFPEVCGGCCEAALARLTKDRWMLTMRCQGDPALKIPSRRMTTISADGGMTWSRPVPLAYEDGSPVWTPASVHRFFVSSRTGKTYLIANILPGPVFGQTPRYPLSIAEFDVDRAVVLKGSIQVIQDRPAGAPEDRRYTNFGEYEDRETGELVLLLPEHPQHKNYADLTEPGDYTGDCLIYRIRLT